MTITVYRRVDSGDNGGEFVSKAYAAANPDTTVKHEYEVESEDPYVEILAQLGKNYRESGGGSAEFQSLIQWVVNGQRQLMEKG